MEMTLRWYGSSFDTVTLKQIRQIPGVTGVITTLYDTAPGEVWSRERIHAMKEEVEANGLHPELKASMFTMRSKSEIKTVTSILTTISKHLKIWEKKIFISYAIISCRFSTGRERSLQENVLTVLPSLPILRLYRQGR